MEYFKILAAPVLMIIGGIITWLIKSKIEELKSVHEKLRKQQLETYSQILEPIIRLFAGFKGDDEDSKLALKEIQSFDYKKTAFDLNLFGSDNVVKAYSDFMQYIYKMEKQEQKDKDPIEMLSYLGKVMLEIRKSLGHKKTRLKEIDMLRFMITDIDQQKNKSG
ncbi:MAG: hypothetical protein R6V04_05425 [bacterium]